MVTYWQNNFKVIKSPCCEQANKSVIFFPVCCSTLCLLCLLARVSCCKVRYVCSAQGSFRIGYHQVTSLPSSVNIDWCEGRSPSDGRHWSFRHQTRVQRVQDNIQPPNFVSIGSVATPTPSIRHTCCQKRYYKIISRMNTKNPCHNNQYFSRTVGDNRGRTRTERFTSEYCQIFCLELHGDINVNWEYLCETFESYDTLIAQTKVSHGQRELM